MVSNPNKADKKKLKIITRGKTISTSIRIDVKENITLADVKEEDIAKKSQKIFKSAKKKKLKKRKTKIYDTINESNNYGIIKMDINNIKGYYPMDSNKTLYNYTFEEACKYDKRNIFQIFYIYLLSKQIIFHTFFNKSPLELFTLRFILFIFMLSCDLSLNALFYLNDNISKKYHYAQNLFLFTFNNNITIIIYSTLLSYLLITLLTKLTNSSNSIRQLFRNEEHKILKNKKYTTTEEAKNKIFSEIRNLLKYLKIKIFILLFIQTIFILFFWYFVTAFCHVYTSTQTSWLLDTFLSILSRFFIEILFAFLFAKIYQIAVGSNIETLYKIVMCLYGFN